MKLSRITLQIFCVGAVTLMLVGSIAPPVAVMAGNLAAPRQQDGSTVHLPVVMTPLTPIIPESTNVLSDATTQFLMAVADDGTFTFSQMTPELANVAPSEVIAGGVSEAAPYGFLRKVTGISTAGESVMVQTAAATLEDAIEQGEVHISQTLSPTGVRNRVLANGVVLSEEQGEFFIKLQDVVLYDEDKKPDTKDDQILANGSIRVAITFNFDMAIQSQKLKQLIFSANVHETAELQLESRVASARIKGELQVGSPYFLPSLTYFIGFFPLVLTPRLTFHIGEDGRVHVGVKAGVTQQATLTAGVRYENNTWSPISEFTNNFQLKPPTLSAGLDLKGYAGPRLTVIINGIIEGPHVDVHAFLKLEANLAETPWWKFYGGLEAPLVVKAAAFGYSLPDYQTVLIGHRVLLAQASTTTRVSVASDGTQANANSGNAAISANGRFIAFDSFASNLVSGDSNNNTDVFVYDRQTGQTERVSVASDGTQGNAESRNPSISDDGRYIAFDSFASNLANGDTNGYQDIFVHDRQAGQTVRISVASDGTQGDYNALDPVISDDGRYIAFTGFASNLVSDDTNDLVDVFVHDQQTGQITLISIASDGTQGNYVSAYPSFISADGRYVTFDSGASNLISDDTNNEYDVFMHDRQTKQTARVSVGSNGIQGNAGSGGAALSEDTRYIAFYSNASNLVNGDTNGEGDVFVYDRQTGQTTLVSVASDGTQGNSLPSGPAISNDGRYVAFYSYASNLVNGDTNNAADVFIHDRQMRQTTRISVASNGLQGDGSSGGATFSADSRFVAFVSSSNNLVSGDTNSVADIFLYDRGY